MKLKKKLKTVLIVTAICALISTVMAYASPGDSNDPLVTLSYITDVLMPDIDSRIEQKVSGAVNSSSTPPSASTQTSGDSFTLVNVKANYKLIGGEGTEFVLRSGKGIIVATNQGGVADLTAGIDLSNGTPIPVNHHLLSPRNDSRGMKFTSDAIVLVKGAYSVSKD